MAGENNNQAVRTYQKQLKDLLQAVYSKQAVFRDFFGGGIQALDGIGENETAFSLKTSDIPMVITSADLSDTTKGYSTDKDIAFGDGTGKTTRFGNRTEIIYQNSDVKYSWGWVFHEGIDRHTVNLGEEDAVADRLDLQAQAKTQMFDDRGGLFISQNAGDTQYLADYTNDKVLALFNALAAAYVNMSAMGIKEAWVNTALYNAIIDHPLTTSAKSSAANIDSNGILTFKGFKIQETPDDKFQTGEVAYTSIVGVGRQFTGINTARTIESEDFDGRALQGAGKAGEYILPANKKAVIKVKLGDAPTPPEGQKADLKKTAK